MINLIYTILCILCLCIGFFVGYKMPKYEQTKLKIPNPIKEIKNKIEDKKEQEKLQEQIDEINLIYENLENYDGTAESQKELKNVEIGIL